MFVMPGLYPRKITLGPADLAFSCVEPPAPCYGPQIMYGNGYRGPRLAIVRWMLTCEDWARTLERHGFTGVNVQMLPGPEPDFVGTIMGRATAPQPDEERHDHSPAADDHCSS
ncbi:hypothetical protein LN042_23310 [Kitasatospora sp. RB6PN24]|uniref:hypothetical protein n=1 Tax=Kitasatospora humi TaxID=2893891 RepID=UPI001E2E3FD6|nr:hypothetical protein [Kitasatospora humi]MCC9309966.1 hypothetical protein [Kitasatospora humi]